MNAQLTVTEERHVVHPLLQLDWVIEGVREHLRDALWRAVGDALRTRLGSRPTWVSTSGLGVSWLHVRLDRLPKYYTHAPYRDPSG